MKTRSAVGFDVWVMAGCGLIGLFRGSVGGFHEDVGSVRRIGGNLAVAAAVLIVVNE